MFTIKEFPIFPGSLVAVPVLSVQVGLSDNVLALMGAMAAVTDYLLYGLVTSSSRFLTWIGKINIILIEMMTDQNFSI